jgi:hypothetical protein
MATHGDKVKKYEAIVRKGFELGLPPDRTSVEKLLYYVDRAEKQGGASHWAAVEARKNAKHVVQDSQKLAALLMAARKYL